MHRSHITGAKNPVLAYLLWLIGGTLGLHRLYLGTARDEVGYLLASGRVTSTE